MSLYVLEGLRPWVIQRISAVYIVLFLLYVSYAIITADTAISDPAAYQSWRYWLAAPVNTTLVGLFIIAILFHAWIGMRDVVLDYIHPLLTRIFILAFLIGFLIGCGLWAFRILLVTVVA